MTVFLHPLYSPDPASSDFFIFLKHRLLLKVVTAMTSAQFKRNCRLNLLTSEDIIKIFQQWDSYWACCTKLQGTALRETKWDSKEMVLSLRKRVPSRNYLITHLIIAKTLKKE
jgi:hypothetical protein